MFYNGNNHFLLSLGKNLPNLLQDSLILGRCAMPKQSTSYKENTTEVNKMTQHCNDVSLSML